MEFVRGQKLSLLPREEIRSLVEVGQNAFLVQLLDVGYLHAGKSLLLGIFQHVCDDAVCVMMQNCCKSFWWSREDPSLCPS